MTDVEGNKNGLFYWGVNGQQANAWNTTGSFQCVVAPVKRTGVDNTIGSSGQCDGTATRDLNLWWTGHPAQRPPAGAVVQAQFWYRDPQNVPNLKKSSMSDAIEFTVGS